MKHERERTAEGRQQWNRTMAARSKTLARAASSPLPQRPALFDCLCSHPRRTQARLLSFLVLVGGGKPIGAAPAPPRVQQEHRVT